MYLCKTIFLYFVTSVLLSLLLFLFSYSDRQKIRINVSHIPIYGSMKILEVYNIYIFPKFEDDYYNFRLPIFSTDHLFLLNLNKQISISLKDHFSPVVNEIEEVHPPQFSIFAERLYRTKFQLASKNRDEILKCSIKIPPWNRDCPSSLRLSRLYRIRRYWNKWKGRRNKLKLRKFFP